MGKNISSDKIKETVLRLLETEPGDELSVQQVASEAKISKQTLYNNYYGLLGVIEDAVNELLIRAAREYSGPCNWYYQVKSMMQMMAERKNIFMHLYNSKYQNDLLRIFLDRAEPYIESCVQYYENKVDIHLYDIGDGSHCHLFFVTPGTVLGVSFFCDTGDGSRCQLFFDAVLVLPVVLTCPLKPDLLTNWSSPWSSHVL